jgi:hypothetical protein
MSETEKKPKIGWHSAEPKKGEKLFVQCRTEGKLILFPLGYIKLVLLFKNTNSSKILLGNLLEIPKRLRK